MAIGARLDRQGDQKARRPEAQKPRSVGEPAGGAILAMGLCQAVPNPPIVLFKSDGNPIVRRSDCGYDSANRSSEAEPWPAES